MKRLIDRPPAIRELSQELNGERAPEQTASTEQLATRDSFSAHDILLERAAGCRGARIIRLG